MESSYMHPRTNVELEAFAGYGTSGSPRCTPRSSPWGHANMGELLGNVESDPLMRRHWQVWQEMATFSRRASAGLNMCHCFSFLADVEGDRYM